jgi:hypothetical protein
LPVSVPLRERGSPIIDNLYFVYRLSDRPFFDSFTATGDAGRNRVAVEKQIICVAYPG